MTRYSSLPCGCVVVQTHQVMTSTPHEEYTHYGSLYVLRLYQVMVDTPYGDCFAVLTKWVFEPLPTAVAASSAAAAASGGSGSSGGGGGGSSSSATVAGGSCSVSVSAELVRSKHPCTAATPTGAIPTAAIPTAAILARCGSRTRGSRSRS